MKVLHFFAAVCSLCLVPNLFAAKDVSSDESYRADKGEVGSEVLSEELAFLIEAGVLILNPETGEVELSKEYEKALFENEILITGDGEASSTCRQCS